MERLKILHIDLDPEAAMIEECGELIAALCHRKRGREGATEEIRDELADVIVVLEILREKYGPKTIDLQVQAVRAKLDRLRRDA